MNGFYFLKPILLYGHSSTKYKLQSFEIFIVVHKQLFNL